jgi:uncharacterized membrane protein
MVRRGAAGVALVLVAVAVAAVALPSGPASPAEAEGPQPPQTTPEGFANAEFEIRVYANGSARWTVRASRPLENQTEVDRFRTFAEEFETTETDAFRDFRSRARRLTAFGTNATGREMNATAFGREARVVELGRTRGVVELSFRWTNFARTDGQRVIVDDVFRGGMFIDSGQQLVIAPGEGLVFESVDPPPDSQSAEGDLAASGTVTWFGERNFADRRPRAVLVSPEQAGTPTQAARADGTAGATATPTPGAGGGDGNGLGMAPLVAVVVVLLGLGGAFALYSGTADGLVPTGGGSGGGTAPESTAAGADAGAGSASAAVPDEELLSDEDRVLGLLEDNGGRMKQVKIVEETDWSKSKVSMLLSDMEDDGEISKLRVGRENIISKAGHEPDAAGSPFEDE